MTRVANDGEAEEEVDESHPAGELRPMRPERVLDTALCAAVAAFVVLRPLYAKGDDVVGSVVAAVVAILLLLAVGGVGDPRLNDAVRWPAAASVEAHAHLRRRLMLRAVLWLVGLSFLLFVLSDRGAVASSVTIGAGIALSQLRRLLSYERRYRVRLYRLPAPRWSLKWFRQVPITVYARPVGERAPTAEAGPAVPD